MSTWWSWLKKDRLNWIAVRRLRVINYERRCDFKLMWCRCWWNTTFNNSLSVFQTDQFGCSLISLTDWLTDWLRSEIGLTVSNRWRKENGKAHKVPFSWDHDYKFVEVVWLKYLNMMMMVERTVCDCRRVSYVWIAKERSGWSAIMWWTKMAGI